DGTGQILGMCFPSPVDAEDQPLREPFAASVRRGRASGETAVFTADVGVLIVLRPPLLEAQIGGSVWRANARESSAARPYELVPDSALAPEGRELRPALTIARRHVDRHVLGEKNADVGAQVGRLVG